MDDAREQAMSHSITVEFGPYGPTAELTCDAPANAGCRARFDECGCPEWWGQGDDDGIPYHTTDDGDRHQGRYDPEWCNEVEWFDAADGLDNTRGKVTFAVEAEWGDEHYTWHVKEQDMNPTLAPRIEARVREARADELLLVAAEFESNANRVVKAKGETERTGYAYEVVEVLRNRAEEVRRNA